MPSLPSSRPDHVVFFGTPAVALDSLHGLVGAGLSVDLVVTGVDKRRSRGSGVSPSPVKSAAREHQIPVEHDLSAVLSRLGSFTGTTLGVVVAYGMILPPELLEVVPMVNLHFSLLPRWRGAAPVERAILSGDTETGVCLMRIREELDAGEIFDCERVPIGVDETLESLRSRLNAVGVPMLVRRCMEGFVAGSPQDGEVTYARKITPDDLRLTWESDELVHRQVRLGAAFGHVANKRVKVIACRRATGDGTSRLRGDVWCVNSTVAVACDTGAIELLVVQPEGRPAMSALDWWNGIRTSRSLRFEA